MACTSGKPSSQQGGEYINCACTKVPRLMLHIDAISGGKYPRIVGKTLWPFRENMGGERKAPWSFDPRSVALGMFEPDSDTTAAGSARKANHNFARRHSHHQRSVDVYLE
jgi:hypothetical protein